MMRAASKSLLDLTGLLKHLYDVSYVATTSRPRINKGGGKMIELTAGRSVVVDRHDKNFDYTLQHATIITSFKEQDTLYVVVMPSPMTATEYCFPEPFVVNVFDLYLNAFSTDIEIDSEGV